MLNRKAETGQQMMFIIFLMMLILTGLGVSSGIILFFGDGIDYRSVEAQVLAGKVSECFENHEISKAEIESGEFYSICRLNQKVLNNEFTLRVNQIGERLISFGDAESCLIKGTKENENFGRCFITRVTNENGTFEIIAGSRQIREKIANA